MNCKIVQLNCTRLQDQKILSTIGLSSSAGIVSTDAWLVEESREHGSSTGSDSHGNIGTSSAACFSAAAEPEPLLVSLHGNIGIFSTACFSAAAEPEPLLVCDGQG